MSATWPPTPEEIERKVRHFENYLNRRALTEVLRWTPSRTKPDAEITVLCWGPDGFFCGWWDSSEGAWRDCESGGIAEGVTHWAEPKGPQEGVTHWAEPKGPQA